MSIVKTVATSKAEQSGHSVSLLPFAIAFPLLCIAFNGCFQGGCQGALDAQSKALHLAAQRGGWTESAR